MADVMKMLVSTTAARNPAATTATTIYTAPALGAMLSRVMIANRGATARTFRLAIIQGSEGLTVAGLAAIHYIAYDISIQGNDTVNFPVGAGMASGDLLIVYSSHTDLTFTPVGIEFA